MASSITCYFRKPDDTLLRKDAAWGSLMSLSSHLPIVCAYVLHDQNPPDPPNMIEFQGNDVYSFADTADGIKVVKIDLQPEKARSHAFHTDGNQPWSDLPAKAAKASNEGVSCPVYDGANYTTLRDLARDDIGFPY